MEEAEKASGELLDTLRETIGIIGKLLEFSNKKESLLTSGNIDGMNQLLAQEEEYVSAFMEIEERRKSSTRALSSIAGIAISEPKSEPRLRDIIVTVELPSHQRELTKARVELEKKLSLLASQNAKIKELLKAKIDYTNFMINLLYIPGNGLQSYNIQGSRKEETAPLRFLDYRA